MWECCIEGQEEKEGADEGVGKEERETITGGVEGTRGETAHAHCSDNRHCIEMHSLTLSPSPLNTAFPIQRFGRRTYRVQCAS